MTPPLLQNTSVTLQHGQSRIQAHISAGQKTAPCGGVTRSSVPPLLPPSPAGPSAGGYLVFCLHEIMTQAAWILGSKVSSQGHKLNLYENRLTSISLPCLPRAPLPLKGCLLLAPPLTALSAPWVQCLLGGQWWPLKAPPLDFLGTDTLEEP